MEEEIVRKSTVANVVKEERTIVSVSRKLERNLTSLREVRQRVVNIREALDMNHYGDRKEEVISDGSEPIRDIVSILEDTSQSMNEVIEDINNRIDSILKTIG